MLRTRILNIGPTIKMKLVLKPLEQDLSNELLYTMKLCVLLAQWLTWLTRDHCNPKVPSSIPAAGKDFP